MKEITWEYLAGFFDGEGCIYSNLKKNHTYAGIYQAEHQSSVLYAIQKFLKKNNIESKIYIRKEIRKNQNYKGVSLEIAHRIELLNFLKVIQPYLFVKKKKCDQVIKEIKQYLTEGGKRHLTTFEKDKAKELWEEGKSCKEISSILGINFNTLNAVIYMNDTKILFQKKSIKKKCIFCGKTYIDEHRRMKYCSKLCKGRAAYKERINSGKNE